MTPFIRVARGVKHAVHRNRCLRVLVKHRIRKAPNQTTSIALMNDGIYLRPSSDACNTRIDRTQELLTQSGSTPPVPGIGVRNV
jgi:hypothetical protein